MRRVDLRAQEATIPAPTEHSASNPIPGPIHAIEQSIQQATGGEAKVAAVDNGDGTYDYIVKCMQHWTDPPANTIRWQFRGTNLGGCRSAWQDHDRDFPHN